MPRPGCVERGAGLVYRLRLSSRDTASRSTSSVKHVWCVALQLRQPLERRSMRRHSPDWPEAAARHLRHLFGRYQGASVMCDG